jgi:hypothetical protein
VSREKQREKSTERKRKSTLRRLVIANLVAALALITTAVTVLWALGLLGSVFAFFF